MARLEDRTLLSGPSGDVLAAVAPKIVLGTAKTGTLAPGEVAFFQIDPTTDGRLVAGVQPETMRLSLLDDRGHVLMQSDGRSPDNRDDQIDQIDLHVPAGTDYLDVENLGGAGAYTLTATLTPATTPFQPISVGSSPIAIVAGDFNGDRRTDLAVVNQNSNDVSVLLGNGDGTFQNQGTYRVGNGPDAIVADDFTGHGRTDLAVANYGSNDVSVPPATSTRFSSWHRRTPMPSVVGTWREHASASTRALPAMPSGLSSSARRTGESRITARIYSQAAVALDAEFRKTGPPAVRIVARYLDRSVDLVCLALELAPAEQRSILLRETIMTDPTLQPIRRRLKSLERLKF